MKLHKNKFFKPIALTIITALTIGLGSFFQSDVLKVRASVQVLLVSHTAIPFGTVFPGEDVSETYTVQLDTSANNATYVTTLESVAGKIDLCPLLNLKSSDNPLEPDTLPNSTVTKNTDGTDHWQVGFGVPALKGTVAQDHKGKIVVSSGDYECKITITTENDPAKIKLTKSASFNQDNGKITYTINYEVTGDGTLHNVVIKDFLPALTTFVSATNGGTHVGGVVTWNLGNLTAPTNGSVQVVVGTFFDLFFDSVLDYKPGVSANGTIRVLDATTNSPVLPNLEFGPFPILNLKDLQFKDAAFVNTSFTGNFGSGTQTKTVDDFAQTFVALGDGGQITVGPTASGIVAYNHGGNDFTLFETPNSGGKDPSCVSVTANNGTVYPLAPNSNCSNQKAYKFQNTGDATAAGIPIDLTILGVPAGVGVKSVTIYDLKDGQILGTTGSPGYDLDTLIMTGPKSCEFENNAQVTASELTEPVTIQNKFKLPIPACEGQVGGTGKGSISGIKYKDKNKNGYKNSDEPKLPGWKIYLDLNNNGVWNNGEPWTLTAEDGSYSFINLDPGTYYVREVQQDGWEQTQPTDPKKYTVVIDNNDVVAKNFGNVKKDNHEDDCDDDKYHREHEDDCDDDKSGHWYNKYFSWHWKW